MLGSNPIIKPATIALILANNHAQEQGREELQGDDDVSSRYFGNLTVTDALWKRFASNPVPF
jgi:hypothetical protein